MICGMNIGMSSPGPLDGTYDIVVVGGGPAGCAAAVAAAEGGQRTLLIERTCSLGGMGTVGLVPAWCPFSDREQQIHRGFADRILRRSLASTPHVDPAEVDWVPISAEALKVIYDDELGRAGVAVRFDTLLVDVKVDAEGAVQALVIADKSGLHLVQAGVYIDATGDADLVARSGVATHQGDDAGGELMPASLCFVLANVEGFGREPHPALAIRREDAAGRQLITRIRQDPRFGMIPDDHICCSWIGPGCLGFNAGHVFHVDNTDPANVSAAIMQGRRLAQVYRDGLATYIPEHFGDAVLVNTGSLLGVRETRRIIADYELTLDDYLARRSFPDEIARNAYFVDRHLLSDELASCDADNWEDLVHGRHPKYAPGESHGIPYRCLCPQALRNVLVAGRCIGTDRTVNGSVRVMPVCLSTGEAAGCAAALAIDTGCDPRALDPSRLRRVLRERGVFFAGD